MNIFQKIIKKDEVVVFDKRTIKLTKKVGEGGYSIVYQGKEVKTGTLYAVKRMHANNKEQAADIENEIRFMVYFVFCLFY
jgi:serine/threonine protein kinase